MNDIRGRARDWVGNHVWARAKRHLWRRRLHDTSFSLLATNCVGGVMLHDLGLRFMTPTINTVLPAESFLRFVDGLGTYLSRPVVDAGRSPAGYPVGKIGDVQVHFVHYATFEDASRKWQERALRVNVHNVRLCMTDRDGFRPEHLVRFAALPHPKVLLSHVPMPEWESVVTVPGFERIGSVGGVTRYCNWFGDRYCDRYFDSVEWMNSGRVVRRTCNWTRR